MPIVEVVFETTTKRFKGDDEPQFLGRNGSGIQTGIEFYGYSRSSGYQKIMLTPITPRGLGKCRIEIPLGKAREVANALLELANDMENEG